MIVHQATPEALADRRPPPNLKECVAVLRRLTPASAPALLIAIAVAAALVGLAAQNGAYDVVPRQTGGLLAWFACGVLALASTSGPRRPHWTGLATTIAALAIAGWIALRLGSSVSAERSATELARAAAHVAPLLLIGWFVPRERWTAVISGAAVAGVVIVAAGFAERLSPGLIESQRTVVFENTSDRLPTPLGYWNAVGSWAVITLLLLVAIASHAARPTVRASALAFAPLTVAVAYLTYSRSAIAAGAIAAVVLVVLARNRWTVSAHLAGLAAAGAVVIGSIHSHPQIANATGDAGAGAVLLTTILAGLALGALAASTGHLGIDDRRLPSRLGRPLALGSSGAVLLVGIIAISSWGPDAWNTFSTGRAQQSGASRLTDLGNGPRVDQWRAALDAWQEQPAAGYGAGTFELIWNQNRNADGSFVRDSHSALLEALAEQGTIGAALLLAFMLGAAAVVLTAWRRADGVLDAGLVAGAGSGIAAFLTGSLFDWFWEVSALAALMLVLLAGLIAATAVTGRHERRTGARRSLRAAVLALSVVGLLLQLPGLVGTSDLRRSQQAASRGDLANARALADGAIDTMPWASSPFLQRALVDEQAGAFAAAIRSLKLAIRRDPQDWRLPLVLARVHAKAGHPRDAIAAYRTARRLRPTGQFFTLPVSAPPPRAYPTP